LTPYPTTAGEVSARRRAEPYLRATEVVLTILFGALAVWNVLATARGSLAGFVGWDFGHYVDAARRWVDTGSPYLPSEVAIPFQFGDLTFLHPPISLILFAPFLVLPAFLFWLVPLAGTVWIIVSWRPERWAWPIMPLQLIWPRFGGAVIVGNTDLWIVFLIAAGLRFGWPILLLAIKPSIAPFAIVEMAALIRADSVPTRRWREIALAAALLAVIAVPFGNLWFEWFAVVRNSPGDPLYSIASIPWLTVPVVAWIAKRRYRRRSDIHPNATPRQEQRRASRERERDRDKRRADDEANVRVRGDEEGGREGEIPADLEHRGEQEDKPEDVE
jgi:hypothetical protein